MIFRRFQGVMVKKSANDRHLEIRDTIRAIQRCLTAF
jgi:hypothetical protein